MGIIDAFPNAKVTHLHDVPGTDERNEWHTPYFKATKDIRDGIGDVGMNPMLIHVLSNINSNLLAIRERLDRDSITREQIDDEEYS